MAEKVEIEIAAIDSASKVIDDIFTLMQSGLKGSALAAGAATAALGAVVGVVATSINSFLQYSETVKNFARNTGTTAEEASRLIQIGDDVRLSASSMEVAFKMLAKQGIDPSIESIKNLSTQYLALQPGAERTTFLIQNFGRSGLEMGKLLERGAGGIDALNRGVEQNLILTDAAISKAEQYKISQDKLNDSWEAFTMSIGVNILPVLTQITDGMNRSIDAQDDYNTKLQEVIETHGNYGDKANNMRVLLMQESEANMAAADAVSAHGDALDSMPVDSAVEGFGALGGAADGAAKNYEGLLSLAIRLNDATAEQIKMAGYQALQEQFKASGGGIDEAEQRLLEQAGIAMGVMNVNGLNAAKKIEMLSQNAASGAMSIEEYTQKINELSDALNNVPTDVSTNVTVTTPTTGGSSPDERDEPGKARGGWISAPGDGSVDTRLVPLANGEYVVNSRAARQNAGLLEAINSGQDVGGGQIVNIYGPVTLELSSADAFSGR